MNIDKLMLDLYPLQRAYPENNEECSEFAVRVFTTMYAVDREAQGLESFEQENYEEYPSF